MADANKDLVAPYIPEILRIMVCVNSHTTAALRLGDAADGKTFKILKDTHTFIPRPKYVHPHTKVVLRDCSRVSSEQGLNLFFQDWANDLGICINGKWYLSRQRIVEMCPSLEEPLTNGIQYLVVRWQLTEECPELMQILSEADNCKHDTYRTSLQ